MRDQYWQEIIDPGDRASQLGKEICFASHGNCDAVRMYPHQPGNFRGAVGFTWKPHILKRMANNSAETWTMLEEVENDGAGGKPQFFTLVGTPEVFTSLGWEIIEMVVEDFSRSGRLACVFSNDLNVKRITEANFPLVEACFKGYGAALAKTKLVNITGEVAVMKHSITAFCDANSGEQLVLTWSGTCTGLAYRPFLIALMNAVTPTALTTNEPKRSAAGLRGHPVKPRSNDLHPRADGPLGELQPDDLPPGRLE